MENASPLFAQEVTAYLRQSADTAVALLALYSGNFVGVATTNPGRDFSDLLRHLAWIPKEQVLLMHGTEKDAVRAQLGTAIVSHADFADAVRAAIDFFAAAIADADMHEQLTNARGCSQSRFTWCLETIAHFSHHRHQLYEHLFAHGTVIPRALLQRLFTGHLVLPTPYDGS